MRPIPHSITITWLLTILYLMGVTSLSEAHPKPLPNLGSSDLTAYDKATEKRLGQAFTAALHKNYTLYSDPDTNNYIRQTGHRIASHIGSNRNIKFYVIADPSINAFAGPDGIIGINTGLIEAVNSEDELASVIAHEIAHVTQNHLSRRYEYASSTGNINSIATILAAILIGMHDPNAAVATMMGGMGLNAQQQLKESRVHETEADAIGINLLHESGYDPKAMGDFFGRLSKESMVNAAQLPEILRTHPVTDARLAKADDRAQQLKQKQRLTHFNDFSLIKSKVARYHNTKPLHEKSTNQSHRCYESNLMDKKETPSQCLIDNAFKDATSAIYFSLYLSKITNAKAHLTPTQLTHINNRALFLMELYPRNPSLLLGYTEHLASRGMIKKAIDLIEHRMEPFQYKHKTYMRLSELYSKLDKMAYAYFNLAAANLEIGNIKRAKHYLEQGLKKEHNPDKKLIAKIETYKQANANLLIINDKREEN